MLKLNLGAGASPLEGYENLDGAKGDQLHALSYADGSVDEIRASHVLVHFPHGQVRLVLEEWVRKLKPGGCLKVAVPDLRQVAEQYLAGDGTYTESYLMGGQIDARDFHFAVFDEAKLTALLRGLGLVAIKRWKSEIEDCAALDVSLNLCGFKPPAAWPKVGAVVSMPRLGFNDFWACAYQELGALRIPLRKTTGAYWDRDLTLGIEQMMAEEDPEWVLTCDYDTVFNRHQVRDLLSIASRYPHADAIAPLQTARHHDAPMFTIRNESGEAVQSLSREALTAGEVLLADTAHFGLTLLRTEKLKAFPKPWFTRLFDPQGGYGEEGCDPDVHFWRQWKEAGNSLYVALRVPVGHAELMVRWPDVNLEATFQRPQQFWKDGVPSNLWR